MSRVRDNGVMQQHSLERPLYYLLILCQEGKENNYIRAGVVLCSDTLAHA